MYVFWDKDRCLSTYLTKFLSLEAFTSWSIGASHHMKRRPLGRVWDEGYF